MKNFISIGGRIILPEDNIVLLEGNENYTNVYTKTGEKHTVATTLKQLENRVSKAFYRSHKSFIINLNEVSSFDESVIKLKNNRKVLVSRRRKQGLREQMNLKRLKEAGILN
ncbi:LytR/AlgR family response regulator transcription factor [Jiulongibacter sp. NS-SX5]|uniref:LytR/AlgR family response regulator transcription factor n=1 Tax=Jiulongibacter sp. NS-SX5 TaxID=3463854 RepID=UPI00405A3D23